MNKKQIEKLESILNERFQIALMTEEQQGKKGKVFSPDNPNFIYYKAIIETLEALGYWWQRSESGKHRIFKD